MASHTLSSAEIRKLKARAQHLDPVVRVGKSGLTGVVLRAIEQALAGRELIKIRCDHERDERNALVGKIAEHTGAVLIMQVGKVAVFHRAEASEEQRGAC